MNLISECASCGAAANQSCSRCHVARYCSRDCQVGHWIIHRLTCAVGAPSPETTSRARIGVIHQGLSLHVIPRLAAHNYPQGAGIVIARVNETRANLASVSAVTVYVTFMHAPREVCSSIDSVNSVPSVTAATTVTTAPLVTLPRAIPRASFNNPFSEYFSDYLLVKYQYDVDVPAFDPAGVITVYVFNDCTLCCGIRPSNAEFVDKLRATTAPPPSPWIIVVEL